MAEQKDGVAAIRAAYVAGLRKLLHEAGGEESQAEAPPADAGGISLLPDASKPADPATVDSLEAFAASHLSAIINKVQISVEHGFSGYVGELEDLAEKYADRIEGEKEGGEAGRIALEIALTLPFFFAAGVMAAGAVTAALVLVKAVDAAASPGVEKALKHAMESEGGKDVLRKAVDKLNEGLSKKVMGPRV